jgi:hypothetical protein
MRTPTHGATYNDSMFTPERPTFERNPANQIQASQTNTPSRSANTRDRYRPAEYAAETGDEGEPRYGDTRPANIRLFNEAQRPRLAIRRDSYPPEGEPTTAPVLSQSRRGSIVSAGGNRPRGLSFYDARERMKSGQVHRPESWHAGVPPTPPRSINKDNFLSQSSPTTPTRQRVHSGNVEEGIPDDFIEPPEPPSPPPEKIPGDVGWALFMNSSFKNNLVAAIGEIVGTTMFLFFAFAGTQVANVNSTNAATTGFNSQKLLYISLSFGFSLMVNVWIFFRISGGLFNPCVRALLILVLMCQFPDRLRLGHTRTSSDGCHWIRSSRLPVLFTDHWCYHCFGSYSWFVALIANAGSEENLLMLSFIL